MKDINKEKFNKKLRRQARTRSKLHGTATRPRLMIKRSLKFMSAQAINDDNNQTIVGLHESKLGLKGISWDVYLHIYPISWASCTCPAHSGQCLK